MISSQAEAKDRMTKDDLRTKAGSLGATAGAALFAAVGITTCLLEASFRTWAVGRYFENRAGIFLDIFLIAAIGSVIALALSSLGRGRNRIIGILSSTASLTIIAVILNT